MEWQSLKFKCRLVFPEGEGWVQGPVEKNRDGEVLLSLSNKIQKSSVWLYVSAPIGITNLKHQAIPARLAAVLISKGYPDLNEPTFFEKNGTNMIQVVATGSTVDGNPRVGVLRAAIQDSRLYFLLSTGEGEKDRVEEGMLMRVADTFRFQESSLSIVATNTYKKHYQIAAITCISFAGILVLGYWTVIFVTRYRKVT